MAERIVSPGVFTRERDLSFLPASIGAIGATMMAGYRLHKGKKAAYYPIIAAIVSIIPI